jgi:hypothetical protein
MDEDEDEDVEDCLETDLAGSVCKKKRIQRSVFLFSISEEYSYCFVGRC